MDNKTIDENERLKKLVEERKIKIRDKVFEECDRVLEYGKKNKNDEKTY